LQAVLKHERAALSLLEIKRYAAQTAHMEESLVLNLSYSRVMQIAHVHEASSLNPFVRAS